MLASDSDASVYEQTYQEVETCLHPMLRAMKLTKRIMEDKRISNKLRMDLTQRRNIINFRLQKNAKDRDADLVNIILPAIAEKVSNLAAYSLNCTL